jgi:hypothetical protein
MVGKPQEPSIANNGIDAMLDSHIRQHEFRTACREEEG